MCTVTLIPLERVTDDAEFAATRAGHRGVDAIAHRSDESDGRPHVRSETHHDGAAPFEGETRGCFRLACNRDELRTRPIAWPPGIRELDGLRVIMPIDLASGGTWIAVSSAGVAMTLLNVNPASTTRLLLDRKSRGVIIPDLIRMRSVQAAAEIARSLDPAMFPPFRLLMVDERIVGECFSDGMSLAIRCTERPRTPSMFTSSGLGDHLVEGPRRALFNELFSSDADWAAVQRTFHRHSWPDRRHLSVCMSRPDARTVSHTVIHVGPERVQLDYYPDAPDACGSPVSLSLPRD